MNKPVFDLATSGSEGMSRRAFLTASATVGGGLLFTATIPLASYAPLTAAATPDAHAITIFARIASSGAVTLIAPNPEMGQGTKTALPMIFAEELGVAWKDVTGIEMADYMGGKMGGQVSGGSFSTPANWLPLRKAGAAGRQMFIAAAAQTWNVPENECNAANSVVTHTPTSKTLKYGELAQKASALPVPDLEKVMLKDESTFSIIGQPVVDPDKARVVTGEQLFGIDFKLPGMKYAVFHKGPVFDAEVKSANIDEVKAQAGVSRVLVFRGAKRVLEDSPTMTAPVIDDGLRGGVAIVADTWWHAQKARQKLKVEWEEGPYAKDSTAGFDAQARQLFTEPAHDTLRVDGDPDAALKGAAKVVRASYSYPFLAHATLEPQNCVASFKDGKVEFWAPTQWPSRSLPTIAAQLGIAQDNIVIHMLRCGGGFSRRLANDYMIEAAVVSREIGAPVKVLWSREDDMQHDMYRPGGYVNLTGGLDAKGKLLAWSNHFAGFARTKVFNRISYPYPELFPAGFVANYSHKTSRIPFNVPVLPLRAPGSNAYAFVFQSFMDELAHAAGRDPIEFQLEILKGPLPEVKTSPAVQPGFEATRMISVIERVRDMCGWSNRKNLPKDTGMGFACYWSHRGYVAQVHQVSVTRNGIKPQKVWTAVDIGRHIVNPSNAENQVQGSIIDGLSAALGQQITLDKGRVVQSNFHDYSLLRNTNIPSIEIDFLKTDNAPTGLGEPAHPPALPAFCNAIFAASGKRVRSLPINVALGIKT